MKKKSIIAQVIYLLILLVIAVSVGLFLYDYVKKQKKPVKRELEKVSQLTTKKDVIYLFINPKLNLKSPSISYQQLSSGLIKYLNDLGYSTKDKSLKIIFPTEENKDRILDEILTTSGKLIVFTPACSQVQMDFIKEFVKRDGKLILFTSCLLDSDGKSINEYSSFYEEIFGANVLSLTNINSDNVLFYVNEEDAKETGVNVISIPVDYFNNAIMLDKCSLKNVIYTQKNDRDYNYMCRSPNALYVDPYFIKLYISSKYGDEKLKETFDKINRVFIYEAQDLFSD